VLSAPLRAPGPKLCTLLAVCPALSSFLTTRFFFFFSPLIYAFLVGLYFFGESNLRCAQSRERLCVWWMRMMLLHVADEDDAIACGG
jgi:hypothetical protein